MDSVAGLGHEIKYVLPAAMAPAARAMIAGSAVPERPHAASHVESIYFDDDQLSAWTEKEASDYLKRKVRLRWYDARSPVFLEIKSRIGTRRRKARLVVELDGAQLSRHGLRAPGLDSIDRFMTRIGQPLAPTLRPIVHLRYRRERFVAAGGDRVCLDWEIEALAAAPGLGLNRSHALLDTAVFEHKAAGRGLPATLVVLESLGARRRSFSKFTACLQALEV